MESTIIHKTGSSNVYASNIPNCFIGMRLLVATLILEAILRVKII